MAIGDLNGDGKLDLAVANGGNRSTVSVLLGNGDGTFQAVVSWSVGAFPRQTAIGDFNGDGRLDLAVANSNESSVSILLHY
ncbi:MAG: VCBS repeat-containing protein [Armatimonadetes bacterium]|nr:VCBS repeat-containing protein [Armatimonadota bacterium]